MSKLTKRILSMMLAVLMVISSVAVFVIPASAAEETDYEAIFKEAFLINPEWDDSQLVRDNILYFTFRGVEREIVCEPERNFNSWADAYEAAYGIGKLDGSNIYTFKPVFIFAPGTYSDTIHLPANATIMGNNAGISPNAELSEDEWTADAVAKNNGWKSNSERHAQETIFTGNFYPSTRTGATFQEQLADGNDQSRFAYYLEVGKPANATINVEIDGVKVQKTSTTAVFTMHHYDKGTTVKYPATAGAVTVTSGRFCNMTVRNSVIDAKGNIFYSANAAYNNVKGYIYDSELLNQNAQIAVRDFSALTMERVFWHDSGTSASLANNCNLVGYNSVYYSSVYKTSDININDCVFYELAGGDNLFMVGSNYDRFHGVANDQNREKSITHNVNITGSIFYNAKSTKSPSAANVINVISHDKTSPINVNVNGNIFHQDGKFVYAPIDITQSHSGTKTKVNFTDNTVTGDYLNTGIGEAKYFIDELEKGITVNGVTFTKENTAVFSPSGNTSGEYTAYFGRQKYIFEIDDENVFPYKSTTTSYNEDVRGSVYHMEAFRNKYIIMPSGSYGNLWISMPATYCGANFGIDPVDKSGATAENNYDWALSEEWGAAGETKINTTNITREVTEGDFVFDGFTLAHRFYDDHRNTRTGDVNVTFVNHVLNTGSTSASTTGGRSYTLSSPLSKNSSDTALGEVYNDSFTLKNTFVVNCGTSRDFLHEFVCAHVTFDNLYLDNTAALKSRNCMGFVKLGIANKNFSYTVKNSNIRNASDDASLFQFNIFETAGTSTQVTSDYDVSASFTNNIFYNAAGTGMIVQGQKTGYFTSFKFDDNKVISDNGKAGWIVNIGSSGNSLDANLLDGNVSFNNNTITGYDEAKYINDMGFGDAKPVATNNDNHNYDAGVAFGDANCQQTTTVRYTCTGCDTYGADCQYFKDVVGAAGAHVWDEGTYNNDATCQADGTKNVTCTVEGCGATDTITAEGTKVAHKYEESAYVANNDATCYKAGTETAKCKWCDQTKTRTNADDPATGKHVWGEYTSNNDATYKEDGTKTAKCTTSGCTATNTVADEGSKLPAPTAVDSSKKFKDVKAGAWYKAAVDHAVTYGLISGITETTFEPNTVITRGMFITILARVAGVDTSKEANAAAKTKFTDVKAGKYYSAAIAWASGEGIVSGMDEKTFAPDSPIQRQQLALMIVNFAKNQNVDLKATEKAIKFADANTIGNWAKDAVAVCQKAGIISGYNEGGKTYFKPAGQATRAEAAQMLYVFHNDFYLK